MYEVQVHNVRTYTDIYIYVTTADDRRVPIYIRGTFCSMDIHLTSKRIYKFFYSISDCELLVFSP